MRKILAIAALVIAAGMMVMADEKPWLDLENCAYCKQFTAQPGLMEHCHHEYHNISNGVVSIFTVEKDYQDKMAAAMLGMQKVGEDIGKGTGAVPVLCGHCEAYGKFMMSGKVNSEEVKSGLMTMALMTSSDSATVAELHAFGEKSNAEGKKMMEAMMMKSSKK
ncbi:MAG: hypothetical protein SGI97_05715 [candidate division Zixibacteria bacterium]|nr:hypothetical protein [candidate division Zixibacteria bacterium]